MENVLKNYCRFVIKNPIKLLVIVFLITGWAVIWLVTQKPLKLDTNFTTLLPDKIPCVVEGERISRLLGSTDYLIVAVESPSPADNRQFIEEIAPKIAALPEVSWTAITEDKSFFRERFALYLDTTDLAEIVGRAKARVSFEKERINPFYVTLEDDNPPDISIVDILEKYQDRLAKHGIRGVFNDKDQSESGFDQANPAADKDYFTTSDGTIFSLIARTTKSSADLDFGRSLVKKVNALILASNPHRNETMVAEVVGSFRNRYKEYNNIVSDIFSSFALSFALIFALILAYFRRIRAILLISVPLLTGIIWTVALTALTLGRLNIVTALIFAVLLGLGIDFGVHMSMRYLDERARQKSLAEALYKAIGKTGRAILTAGITTAGAMAVLIFSSFKGFSEFGIIATMGIFLCLLSYLLVLPAMAVLMERISVPKTWRLRSDPDRAIRPTTLSRRQQLILWAAIVLVSGLSLWSLPNLAFEYNFRNLKGEDVSTNIHYGRSIGGGTSPVVALLPTAEDARELTSHLEKIVTQEAAVPVALERVFSLFSFVPEDQQHKVALLGELRAYIDEGLKLKDLDEKTRTRLAEIKKWTQVQPFTRDDLPDWVLAKFREKDGTLGRMVYLDSGRDDYRVDQIAEFYDHYGCIAMSGKEAIHPSSTGFILVEVIRAVQRDGLLITVGACMVVFLILLLDLRSPRKALFVFFPLAVGLLWTAGIMVALNIKIGLYNMLVLPLLLGVGIDAAVHFYHAYQERGPGRLRYVLQTTGVAIIISTMTTGAGFVGLTIVSHAGLRSIGVLALIGIFTCLAGTLLTMPLMIILQETCTNRQQSGPDSR